jgi:hypothetical protein
MKRRKPTSKLAADEIRVVASWRDQEISQTFSSGGQPVGPRDLKAILHAIGKGLGMRAEDRPQPRMEMPLHEQEQFRRAGFSLEPIEGPDPFELGRIAYLTILETSYDVAAAARLLRVNTSRIRQRLIARELYGIKEGKKWLLPRFQFLGNRLVPGIERVIPHIRPEQHPLGTVNWFHIPNPDLAIGEDEVPTTPLDWLASGRDPTAVAELVGDYGW